MNPKRSYGHIIRENWCKGCGICVAYCPRKVLTLVGGKVFAERPHDCIGCRLCELRCPDFAIEIREADVAAKPEVATAVDYTVPPEASHA